MGEWKGFMFQGYELKVIKCHNPTSGLKREKLDRANSSWPIVYVT